jgi:hypothetical protein
MKENDETETPPKDSTPSVSAVERLVKLRKILKDAETAYSVSCHIGDDKHTTDMWYSNVVSAHANYEKARISAAT